MCALFCDCESLISVYIYVLIGNRRLEVAEEVAEKQVQNQRREKMRQSINDSALKKKQREQQESERLNRDRLEKDKENKPIAAVSATFSTVATAIKQKKGLS
ncbi:unnamed protein product [Symbiodinium microadriaticum]|nr:unnamed protein product [Symbiodinium microadriaticum]